MKKSRKKKTHPREKRYFSEDFRRARVKEYEQGQISVVEISRAYQVSRGAVYKWIHKYSIQYQKGVVKVVEEKSETRKRLALEQKVKDLERLIGQQQVQLKYYEKLLELISVHYEVDFEKNSEWKSLPGFLSIDPPTI